MPVGYLARSPRLARPGTAAEGNRHLLPEPLIAKCVTRVCRCADFLQLHRLQFAAEKLQIRGSSVGVIRAERKKYGMGSDQLAAVAQCVRAEARPAVGTRSIDHPGAHGVELDVAMAAQQIGFGLNDAGPETSFPQCAAAFVDAIHVLYVALAKVLHQQGSSVGSARR